MTQKIEDENLIKLLGIEELPDERKAQIIEKVSQLVQQRLLIRILDSLSETDRTAFEQMMDKEDQNAINAFLSEHVPNMVDLLNEEIATIKEELNGLGSKID